MLASWMLYAALMSILILLAAFGAERALASRGRPTRVVWAVAIALSVAWPVGSTAARRLSERLRPARMLPFTIVVQAPVAEQTGEPDAAARARQIDQALVGLWLALSAILLVRLVHAAATIERSRADWKPGRIAGQRVKFSTHVGPAVVGLRTMDIVVPEWIMALDAPLRDIVLRHEEEHRIAGDPYLLFGAAVAAMLMPWNLALWVQARRLRLAVEMDCDARVLRAHPSPERYGMLMLTIAQRRSSAPASFAPMLSEPTTDLERRILAMRSITHGRPGRTTGWIGALAAVALLAFAGSLQSAVTPRAPHDDAQPGLRQLDAVTTVAQQQARPRRPIPAYPAMLASANVEGAVLVQFATRADSSVDPASILMLMSTHQAFAAAVRTAVRGWRGPANTKFKIPYFFVMTDQTGRELEGMEADMPAGSILIAGRRPNAGRVAGANAVVQTGRPSAAVASGTAYYDFQVEDQATPMPGSVTPRYPEMLRSANVEGQVLAQFVVDADGTADMSTFKVLQSTHDLFTHSVRDALASMRFSPALVGGQPVRQMIQMPFQFSLAAHRTASPR